MGNEQSQKEKIREPDTESGAKKQVSEPATAGAESSKSAPSVEPSRAGVGGDDPDVKTKEKGKENVSEGSSGVHHDAKTDQIHSHPDNQKQQEQKAEVPRAEYTNTNTSRKDAPVLREVTSDADKKGDQASEIDKRLPPPPSEVASVTTKDEHVGSKNVHVFDEKPVDKSKPSSSDEKPVDTSKPPISAGKPVEDGKSNTTDEKPVGKRYITDEKPTDNSKAHISDDKSVDNSKPNIPDEKPTDNSKPHIPESQETAGAGLPLAETKDVRLAELSEKETSKPLAEQIETEKTPVEANGLTEKSASIVRIIDEESCADKEGASALPNGLLPHLEANLNSDNIHAESKTKATEADGSYQNDKAFGASQSFDNENSFPGTVLLTNNVQAESKTMITEKDQKAKAFAASESFGNENSSTGSLLVDTNNGLIENKSKKDNKELITSTEVNASVLTDINANSNSAKGDTENGILNAFPKETAKISLNRLISEDLQDDDLFTLSKESMLEASDVAVKDMDYLGSKTKIEDQKERESRSTEIKVIEESVTFLHTVAASENRNDILTEGSNEKTEVDQKVLQSHEKTIGSVDNPAEGVLEPEDDLKGSLPRTMVPSCKEELNHDKAFQKIHDSDIVKTTHSEPDESCTKAKMESKWEAEPLPSLRTYQQTVAKEGLATLQQKNQPTPAHDDLSKSPKPEAWNMEDLKKPLLATDSVTPEGKKDPNTDQDVDEAKKSVESISDNMRTPLVGLQADSAAVTSKGSTKSDPDGSTKGSSATKPSPAKRLLSTFSSKEGKSKSMLCGCVRPRAEG